MATIKTESQDYHSHNWVNSSIPTEKRCGRLRENGTGCGAILVSQFEYDYRKRAWDDYFELVKTTPSYLEYKEMVTAYKAKDKVKMQELKEKRMKRGQLVKNEYGDEVFELDEDKRLPKPEFKDPFAYTLYVIA